MKSITTPNLTDHISSPSQSISPSLFSYSTSTPSSDLEIRAHLPQLPRVRPPSTDIQRSYTLNSTSNDNDTSNIMIDNFEVKDETRNISSTMFLPSFSNQDNTYNLSSSSSSSSNTSHSLPSSPIKYPISSSPSYHPTESSPLLQPGVSPSASPSSLSPFSSSSSLSFIEKRRLGKVAKERRLLAASEDSNVWMRSFRACFSWLIIQFDNPNPHTMVAIYSILLLATSVGNSIFFKKMLNHMENYVYFLNQFTSFMLNEIQLYTRIQFTLCEATFAPIFFFAVLYEFYFTNYITKEMTDFSKLKFFWMGVFDSISGVLTLFGAVHTSGSNQALLTNAVIPVTMILSYIILRQRYKISQYAGAAIIMFGISSVLLIPQLLESADYLYSDSDNELDDNSDLPLFNLLFILSVIPGALSSIYKELAFVDADIDANYLQAWVALWQLIFGFALIPLNTLSFLGAQAVPFSQLGSAFINGFWCLLGYNLIQPPDCSKTHLGLNGLPPCDNCPGSWIPLTLYIIFNLLFNVFTILLIKYGSATLMFIIMTLRLPLIQIAFSIQSINDPPDPFDWTSALGLGIILMGLIIYRWPTKKVQALPSTSNINISSTSRVNNNNVLPPIVLTRSKSTGSLYDLDEQNYEESDTSHLSIPVIGWGVTSLFSSLHHAKYIRIKLQRSDEQIRNALYSKLNVIESPVTINTRVSNVANNGNANITTNSSTGTPKRSPIMTTRGRATTPPSKPTNNNNNHSPMTVSTSSTKELGRGVNSTSNTKPISIHSFTPPPPTYSSSSSSSSSPPSSSSEYPDMSSFQLPDPVKLPKQHSYGSLRSLHQQNKRGEKGKEFR